MSSDTTEPNVTPDRTDVIPDTYAVYVGDETIHVFQYRVTLAEQDGEWYYVESLNRDEGPRLSLDHAQPAAPSNEGYWIYSKSYDCQLDCE